MKRLIINADDFNLTRGCDRAITEAMESGAVSSTSCLVWGAQPTIPAGMKAGVHLRLTDGVSVLPPLEVSSLVTNMDGLFPRSRDAVAALNFDLHEVYKEWHAQVVAFHATPTHLDTHRHTHSIIGIDLVYEQLCGELGVAGVPLSMRQAERLRAGGVPCADYTEIRWTSGLANDLMRYLAEDFGRYETVHLMCHPGINDADLRKWSTMTDVRERELAVLISEPWRAWLEEQQIHVIGMDQLEKPADQLEKVDILFLTWNRPEYAAASLAALAENTDWNRVRRLLIYTDGDAMRNGYIARLPIPLDCIEYNTDRHGGPVAIMNHYLTQCQPAPWFVKLDNDVVVPPGWLTNCMEIARRNPNVDLLGIEPVHPVDAHMDIAGFSAEPCGHIGGIGLMRTAAFEELPVPAGRLGFSDWQIKHDVVKAWIRPALPVILLDRLPFEPWASLGARYEAAGWQRPWKHYTDADSAIWSWWRE